MHGESTIENCPPAILNILKRIDGSKLEIKGPPEWKKESKNMDYAVNIDSSCQVQKGESTVIKFFTILSQSRRNYDMNFETLVVHSLFKADECFGSWKGGHGSAKCKSKDLKLFPNSHNIGWSNGWILTSESFLSFEDD